MLGQPHPEEVFVTVTDDKVIDVTGDPAEVAVARDGLRLAFVAHLGCNGCRPRSVLILCQVLRWQACKRSPSSWESSVTVQRRPAAGPRRPRRSHSIRPSMPRSIAAW